MTGILNLIKQNERPIGVMVSRSYLLHFGNKIPTAIVLSYINNLYKPNKMGKSALNVNRNGVLWLAKSSIDFKNESGLSRGQVQTAIKNLVNLGIIEVKVFQFNGAPTRHIRVLQAEGKGMLTSNIKLPERNDEQPNGIYKVNSGKQIASVCDAS